MTTNSQLLRLTVDDKQFYLSTNNIKKYQGSLLFKVLSGKTTDPRIIPTDEGFYIDADKDSFLWIVSYLRGYPVDFEGLSVELKRKIHYDAKYFQLHDICHVFDGVRAAPDKKVGELVDMLDRCSDEDPATSEVEPKDHTLDDPNFVDRTLNGGGGRDVDSEKGSDGGRFKLDDDHELGGGGDVDDDDNNDYDNDSEDDTNLEDMLQINEKEKEEFDKDLELRLKKMKEVSQTRAPPQVFDTSLLLGTNKTKIEELINTIQEKLSGHEAVDMITHLSNDQNICDLLKNFNSRFEDPKPKSKANQQQQQQQQQHGSSSKLLTQLIQSTQPARAAAQPASQLKEIKGVKEVQQQQQHTPKVIMSAPRGSSIFEKYVQRSAQTAQTVKSPVNETLNEQPKNVAGNKAPTDTKPKSSKIKTSYIKLSNLQ